MLSGELSKSSLKQSGLDRRRSRNPERLVKARNTMGSWRLESLPVLYLRRTSLLLILTSFACRTNEGALSPGWRFGISAENTKHGIKASRNTATSELERDILADTEAVLKLWNEEHKWRVKRSRGSFEITCTSSTVNSCVTELFEWLICHRSHCEKRQEMLFQLNC